MKLRLLSESDSRAIYQTAIRILREMGMLVMDQDTRRMLQGAGCKESEDGYLHFSEKLIQDSLASVPDRMVLYNRHGEPAVDSSAAVPHFAPGLNCINILDHRSGEHRLFTNTHPRQLEGCRRVGVVLPVSLHEVLPGGLAIAKLEQDAAEVHEKHRIALPAGEPEGHPAHPFALGGVAHHSLAEPHRGEIYGVLGRDLQRLIEKLESVSIIVPLDARLCLYVELSRLESVPGLELKRTCQFGPSDAKYNLTYSLSDIEPVVVKAVTDNPNFFPAFRPGILQVMFLLTSFDTLKGTGMGVRGQNDGNCPY